MIVRILSLALACAALATAEPAPHPATLRVVGTEIRDHGGTGQAIRLRGVNLAWIHLRSGGLPHPQSGALPVGVDQDMARTGRFTTDSLLAQRFGREGRDRLLETYLANWISTTDLDLVASMGLNAVRVPFSYKTLMEEDGAEKPDEVAFRWMDWVVAQCAQRRIHVIFDLHMVQGTQNTPRPRDNPQSYWNNETYQDRASQVWKRVATRYRGHPWIAGFELLNEPWGIPVQQYQRMYQAIRSIDADRIILVQSWGLAKFPRLSETGWTNVVCNIHFYPGSGVLTERRIELAQFRAEVARIRADPEDDRKIPIHIGEFNMSAIDAVRAWEEDGFSWTMWQWKGGDQEPAAVVRAASWLPAGRRAPDLYNDDADAIEALFRLYRTPAGFSDLVPKFRDQLSMPVAKDDEVRANGVITPAALLANDRSLGSGAVLAVHLQQAPQHGTLVPCEGGWTYVPAAGPAVEDRFTYLVRDAHLGAVSAYPAIVRIVP
jgi:endoglucanase